MDSYFPPAVQLGATTSAPHPSRNEGTSTTGWHARHNGGHSSAETGSISTATEDLDLYSLAGLPVLDESIPPDELPDDVIIHDAHDLPYPVRYVRVTPLAKGPRLYAVPVRDPTAEPERPRRVAQLHLANDNHIGHGRGHSTVFRAPLTLPVAAGSEVATRVRVVAKTPAPVCGSHRQLHQEARMYHAFPRELSELATSTRHRGDPSLEVGGPQHQRRGSEGSCEVPQKRRMSWRDSLPRFRRKPKKPAEKQPTRAAEAPVTKPQQNAGEVPVRPLKALDVPPVVPKLFGYYLLLKPDGRVFFELSEGHGECGEDGACGVAWPPAILLIEDCGVPIEPRLFSDAHRWDCYRLLDGLHSAGFVARQLALTAWTEKMLVQPGPLAVPHDARSYATPSFRLVDFGRAQCRQAGFEEHWQEWCDHDLDGAFDALQLDHRAQ